MSAVFLGAGDQGLTDSETALIVAAVGGISALLVAVVGAFVAVSRARSDRRREVYSNATRAALAWTELLYRVRRRKAGGEYDLIGRFHDAQEELSFYTAWIGSDSQYLQRSFARFIKAVKADLEPLIQAAWTEPVRPAPGDALPDDAHPSVDEAQEAFLQDIRSHLSIWPWRRIALAWRNRDAR